MITQAGDNSMKKQPELTAQTKENLFQSFWSLYCQKSIEHITIKEITANAGYNRSTFYEYFVDIYDVLNQLEDDLLEYLKEQVLNSLENGMSDDIIQNLANVYEAKGEYLSVLLGENGDSNFAQKMKTTMRPNIINAFGLPEKDIHTSYIFEFGMSAIIGTITHWYNHKKELPSTELVRVLRSMLATGIVPEIQKYSNRTFSTLG
jgi:AcrR family transcriptional regulator